MVKIVQLKQTTDMTHPCTELVQYLSEVKNVVIKSCGEIKTYFMFNKLRPKKKKKKKSLGAKTPEFLS
jgi:hypothetical protein